MSKIKKHKRICQYCKNQFLAKTEEVNRGAAKFCTLKCSNDFRKGKKLTENQKKNMIGKNKGYLHRNWKGGRLIKVGYLRVLIPSHPNCDCQGYMFEHRLIMEKHIGRPLLKTEIVHHINGEKLDNRIENLMLFSCHKDHNSFESKNRERNKGGRFQ